MIEYIGIPDEQLVQKVIRRAANYDIHVVDERGKDPAQLEPIQENYPREMRVWRYNGNVHYALQLPKGEAGDWLDVLFRDASAIKLRTRSDEQS